MPPGADAVWSIPTYVGSMCYAADASGNGCTSPEFLGACVNTGAYFLKLSSAFAEDFLEQNLNFAWSDLPEGWDTSTDELPPQCDFNGAIGEQCSFAWLVTQNPGWFSGGADA